MGTVDEIICCDLCKNILKYNDEIVNMSFSIYHVDTKEEERYCIDCLEILEKEEEENNRKKKIKRRK